VIYHAALNDILCNIDENHDAGILRLALLLDDCLAQQGETHYGVALASK
jgi:hypothetical protein